MSKTGQEFAQMANAMAAATGLKPEQLAQALAPPPLAATGLSQIAAQVLGRSGFAASFPQPYSQDPSQLEAALQAAAEAAKKKAEQGEWESFQRGIRMATEALVDKKERARAWDRYVVAAMAAGKTDAEAVELADTLLEARDDRFFDPKN